MNDDEKSTFGYPASHHIESVETKAAAPFQPNPTHDRVPVRAMSKMRQRAKRMLGKANDVKNDLVEFIWGPQMPKHGNWTTTPPEGYPVGRIRPLYSEMSVREQWKDFRLDFLFNFECMMAVGGAPFGVPLSFVGRYSGRSIDDDNPEVAYWLWVQEDTGRDYSYMIRSVL